MNQMKSLKGSRHQLLPFDEFFQLKSHGELRTFLSCLKPDEPFEGALLRYAATWSLANESDDPNTAFNPRAYLSEDLSAAMIGRCPCIFLGSNEWAVRATAPFDVLSQRIEQFTNHLSTIRHKYPSKMLTLLVVPEKDYVLEKLFLKTDNYRGMTCALNYLEAMTSEMDIGFICNQAFDGMDVFQSEPDFEYPDTHLSTRNYCQIFGFAIKSMGYDWTQVERMLRYEPFQDYLDLVDKLQGLHPNPYEITAPVLPHSEFLISDGFPDFQTPLGDTWQKFANSRALIEKRILLLGDSHSSISARRKLTYLFAASFSETEFYWNPCGIPGPLPDTGADHIVLEISQRFLF